MDTLEIVQLVATILACLVSVGALFASFHSLKLSKSQLRLSQEEFQGDRRIALRAKVSDAGISFEPTDSSQEVHSVTIGFPSEFGGRDIELIAGRLHIDHESWQKLVKRLFLELIPEGDDTHAAVLPKAVIPLLFEVHGHTRGVPSTSTAIYDLYLTVTRFQSDCVLQAVGVGLNGYIDSPSFGRQNLDEVWLIYRQGLVEACR